MLGRRKKSRPVRQIVNTCVVAYSELSNSETNNNPVDLSFKSTALSTAATTTGHQTQQQQPVILSVPQYNPAKETGTQYNPALESSAPQYNLPSTTITIHTPGKIHEFIFYCYNNS